MLRGARCYYNLLSMLYIFKIGTTYTCIFYINRKGCQFDFLLTYLIGLICNIFVLTRTEQNVNGCCFGYKWDRSKGHCIGMIDSFMFYTTSAVHVFQPPLMSGTGVNNIKKAKTFIYTDTLFVQEFAISN